MTYKEANDSQESIKITEHNENAAFRVSDLWGDSVNEGSGFVAIPMALLRLQKFLGLSATDMLVLTNLLAHRWRPDDVVFPRTSIIANRMGVTNRTVQRSIEKLIKLGLMSRARTDSGLRAFDFRLLVERLERNVGTSLQFKFKESLDA